MSVTYTPTTNFGAKDSLPSNDPDKVIKGSEFTTEFTAIQTAFSLAAPVASPTFTGTVTIPTADINGGNIDGTVIGAATPAAATFSGLTVGYDRAGVSGGFILYDDNQSENRLSLTTGGGAGVNAVINQSGGAFNITDASLNTIASFADNGDISFYEDTGTTPKFFWDASAESLGIGNSSPQAKLDVTGAGGGAGVAFRTTDSSLNETFFVLDGGRSGVRYTPFSIGIPRTTAVATNAVFQVEEAGYLTVLNSGNVGIGTTAPQHLLQVSSSSNFGAVLKVSDTGSQSTGAISLGNGLSSTLNVGMWRGAANSYSTAGNTLNIQGAGIQFMSAGAFGSGTERMRITNAGNVGIGTSSPDSIFTVARGGTSDWSAKFHRGNRTDQGIYTDGTGISFQGVDATNGYTAVRIAGTNVDSNSYNHIRFDTYGAERMRIDSSGVLNIKNTGSTADFISETATSFIVGDGSGTQAMTVYSGTANNGALYFADGSTGNATYRGGVQYLHGSDAMRFFTSSAERMRIDSSGNLLVGKTSADLATNGASITPSGSIFTRDGFEVLALNRKTSDGSIIDFYKDGTTVGSISTEGGDLNIGTGDTGLQFVDSVDAIRPFNITTNADRDAAVDLGVSYTRFKDLYLSGGVYLGGTGAANLLDDYEEGTHVATVTPQTSGTITLTGSINTLAYTKVGRQVSVTGWLNVASVSSPVGSYVTVSLPFAVANLTESSGYVGGAASVYDWSTSGYIAAPQLSEEGVSSIRIYYPVASTAGGTIYLFSFVYFTS